MVECIKPSIRVREGMVFPRDDESAKHKGSYRGKAILIEDIESQLYSRV